MKTSPLAVLVDLDGTLVDTAADLAAAANRMRADFDLPELPVARIAGFVGRGAEVLVHRSMTDTLDGIVEAVRFEAAKRAFYRHYHDVNGVYGRPFPGADAALDALRARGLQLACVTNKPREFTVPLLERLALAQRFDVIVAGDDVKEKKPHPALLLEACARLQIAAADAVMLGDSINDAQAAAAAGCRVVLVETGYNEGESIRLLADAPHVDAIVSGLAEAVAVILARVVR